jgi:hypothetical protein
MKNVTIAVRKKQDSWTGAIVVDGEFQDAFTTGFHLGDVVTEQLAPILDTVAQGRVTISVSVGE